MTKPLVSLENLSVSLGEKPILTNLCASIQRGRISALMGLNGSGKTTLLRTLLKEVPYTGTIRFHCGHDHSRPAPQHMGYVPQRLQFESNLPITVAELMALGITAWPLFLGISEATRDRIRLMLDRVWAKQLENRPVRGLSGGELQRVLLALALEPEPELLLLDEPAAGIDFKHQGEFYALIHQLNKSTGMTVIMVSHDLSIVIEHVDHVLCLRDGKIVCEGTPQMLTGSTMEEVFGSGRQAYHHHH
jgi:zinc transport system ATP-binding protein